MIARFFSIAWFTLLAGVLVGSPAAGSPSGPMALPDGGEVRISDIVDGDTVALDDGRQIRLVGIQAPKLPLGRAGFVAWPLAHESKSHLERLLVEPEATLRLPTTTSDRHGRVLAHVMTPSGVWLQGAMLSAGMARVYTFADNRLLAAEMLALENDARINRRGMWAHAAYAVRSPDFVHDDINSFQLVAGRVLDVATVGRWTYLNFGKNWRTDFTVRIEKPSLKAFGEAGIDPKTFEGSKVRVRGWVHSRNGPMMDVSHPEQIERLAD